MSTINLGRTLEENNIAEKCLCSAFSMTIILFSAVVKYLLKSIMYFIQKFNFRVYKSNININKSSTQKKL